MRRILLITLLFSINTPAFSQDFNNEEIIAIGKYYSSFMFRNSPPKSVSKKLGKEVSPQLAATVKFVIESTKENNKVLTDQYLKLPDSTTLKAIYIIDALHQNPHKSNHPLHLLWLIVSKKQPFLITN